MKKALSMLLAIVMVLSMLTMSVFAASNPTISLETDFTPDLEVGDTFTVTANLAGNTRFDGLALSLKWNENAVRFTGFKKNGRVVASEVCDASLGYNAATVNDANGMFAALDTSGLGYDTNGMLFVANFEIMGDGALDIGFKTDSVEEFMMVANQNGQQIRLEPTLDLSAVQGLTVGGKPVGPEMPEDAPFAAITTDAGAILDIKYLDEDEEPLTLSFNNSDVPYYIVTIPANATQAYVTAPDQVVMKAGDMSREWATGYAVDLSDTSVSYMPNYDFTMDGEAVKVIVPMNMHVDANPTWNQPAYDLCFVADAGDVATHAFGIEDKDFACLGLISFVYEEAGEEEEIYSITIDENMVGGTLTVANENGDPITEAAAGDYVFVTITPAEGYSGNSYTINGELANDVIFQMPEEDVILSATFTPIHTCSYTESVVDAKYLKENATCQSGAVYYKSCTCGKFATTAETFVSGETVACVYENGVCKWCGEAATEPILSFTAGGQTLEAVTAEDYCSEFEVTAQKLTVTVPDGVNTVTINCAASMCAYIDHVSSDLSPSGKSAEIDLTQDLTFVCVPVTLDDGSDAYYHVYFEQEAGDVDPEPEDPAVTPGYTFATSADVSAENGGTAVVKVKITGHSDPNVTSYNAYDLTLTFDSDNLEYQGYDGAVKSDNGRVEVDAENGTIRIVGCGTDKPFGTEIAELTFKTKAEGNANVTISKVQVSDKETAQFDNVPEATPKHDEDDTGADETPDVSVIVVPYTVYKPGFISGENKVLHGETYTFSYTDTTNYTYDDLTVKVGGTAIETLIPDENGVYTIANVTGAVEITATQTANSYDVIFNEENTAKVEGSNKATYGTPYIFTVTPSTEDMAIDTVKVTLADGTEIPYTLNENGQYVIEGTDITGAFTITVTEKKDMTTIKFEGIEETEIEGGKLIVAAKIGETFSFTLIKDENFDYIAKIGDTELPVDEMGNYIIPAELVGENEVIVKIEKVDNTKATIDVKEYISLDGEVMFLVTAKWRDKVLAYGEDTMYYSDKYTVTGETEAGAYCWLVVSTDDMNTIELVKAAAEAAIVEAAEGTTATAVNYKYDINGTTIVDVNDAQLAYDMYNASYMEFNDTLPMWKFLEADMETDGKLDTKDVAAIINYIVSGANA